MLLRLRLPKTLRWVLQIALVYAMLLTLLRALTFFLFNPGTETAEAIWFSFLLGLRFDLRWISLLLLPVLIAGSLHSFSPFYSPRNRQFWTWYLTLGSFLIFLLYAIDFGCFAYFHVRLGATVLNFADDAAIALQMLWQMYPLFWMVTGLVVVVLLLRYGFQKMYRMANAGHPTPEAGVGKHWFLVFFFLLAGAVYGSFPEPLRWNVAFRQNADFSGYLSLNPLQSVYSTLDTRKPHFDEAKMKELSPFLDNWLRGRSDLQNRDTAEAPVKHFTGRPNIILVVCESFSMYKTSMSGNTLQATPYFQSLCNDGLFFERCFSPHFSTARGMFAIITGIPDVQLAKFSTRTEAAKNQHTIINNFGGYSRYYFLGGSPSFNNFEGLLQNVKGVKMKTEGSFSSPPLDVWGISDKALLLEANKVFREEEKPFFAIVQTAGNHPPYSIAAEDKDFVPQIAEEETLKGAGFESVQQYNAMRYFDYSIRAFMEAAKKEAYFDNTVFVFVGDHGVAGNAGEVYPPVWTEDRITEMHVPLLFYAPGHVKAERRSEVVSQVDVLPTIAAITQQKHLNRTLGRNILNRQNNHSAFFIRHDEGEIGVLTDEFYFTKNIRFDKETLKALEPGAKVTANQRDSVQKNLSRLTSAYWETARWMLVHNPQ